MMTGAVHNVLEAVGGTPIVKLNNVGSHPAAEIYVKLEYLNPGGSMKDRVAIHIIHDYERRGMLKPGGTIVEATSGNTGMGLALVAAIRGYKTIFVMPDKMSEEKIKALHAFGARVVVCPTHVDPEDPRSYYRVSRRLAEETPGAVLANQYYNPANPEAHYVSTAPEIWAQTGGELDVFVAGMGTGGTISGCARFFKEKKPGIVWVDNTFATPALQRPLEMGATAVVHSTTKYLNGHSDVVGGAIVVNDPDLHARLAYLQNAVGAVPGPTDAWLVLRGIKTLSVRMARHCANAAAVADFLASHPRVIRVNYPGRRDHPQHAIAARQMKDFGGMVSFEVEGGVDAARRVVSSTRIFALAESLGGVESLIEAPALMTHASIPRELRLQRGLADGLIRLSVGIEDVADLIADLEQAL